MFKYNMRDRVKDTVSGWEGLITVRTEHLNGCLQYCVRKTELDKDGKLQDGEWFDEQQLEKVAAAPSAKQRVESRTGGPQRDQSPSSPV